MAYLPHPQVAANGLHDIMRSDTLRLVDDQEPTFEKEKGPSVEKGGRVTAAAYTG